MIEIPEIGALVSAEGKRGVVVAVDVNGVQVLCEGERGVQPFFPAQLEPAEPLPAPANTHADRLAFLQALPAESRRILSAALMMLVTVPSAQVRDAGRAYRFVHKLYWPT